MAERHPAWVRSCGDCQRLIFDADGRPTDSPRPPGFPPPCGVCPKLDGVADKKPLAPADDFDGLFADLERWHAEGRAVGFPAGVDPLMRAIARLFHEHDRREEAGGSRRAAADALADLLVTAGILRRVGT